MINNVRFNGDCPVEYYKRIKRSKINGKRPDYTSFNIKENRWVGDYFFYKEKKINGIDVNNCSCIIRYDDNKIAKIYIRYMKENYKEDLGSLIDTSKLIKLIESLDYKPCYIWFHLNNEKPYYVKSFCIGRYMEGNKK
ncbi:MAG: hypothetical protein LBF97_00955 [Elusimicrobiota bacterium]|jgi:hypothetical protein|nr:hypothetical protein [Elusimicrobiota bacterium]